MRSRRSVQRFDMLDADGGIVIDLTQREVDDEALAVPTLTLEVSGTANLAAEREVDTRVAQVQDGPGSRRSDSVVRWRATTLGRLARRFDIPRKVFQQGRAAVPSRWSGPAHRAFDLAGASVMLVLAGPVMVASAIAVKATSPGPVFYRHTRLGVDGRTIRVWKFRSMISDADELVAEAREIAAVQDLATVDAPTFKSADDPRVTAVGRWMRRTGIDELPQLFNVIAGDMSLVGPRPLVEEEIDTLPPDVTKVRQAVPPGITCLWQVLRHDDTSFQERMHLDLLYAEHRSLRLDLAVLATTPMALVRGGGSF